MAALINPPDKDRHPCQHDPTGSAQAVICIPERRIRAHERYAKISIYWVQNIALCVDQAQARDSDAGMSGLFLDLQLYPGAQIFFGYSPSEYGVA